MAANTANFMKSASDALKLFSCSKFYWCDSHIGLQWIKKTWYRYTLDRKMTSFRQSKNIIAL